MSLPTVTVTGHYQTADGHPETGTVTFTPSAPLTSSSNSVVIQPGPVTVTLDGNGSFTASLLATDAANVLPSGWTYQVVERLGTSSIPVGRTYNILLPQAQSPVDISAISPVAAAGITSSFVPISSVRTITGATVSANAFDVLECDATAQPVTVTLPANIAGTTVIIKKVDSSANTVTITGTVDGTTNPTLSYQYGSMELVADGTRWLRVVRPALGALVDYPATTDARYVQQTQVGAASGVAQLDSTSMVPPAQIPGVYMPPTRRMPRFVQPSTIITQMQAGHGFTNNAGSTFTANDTADFLIPSQSCKITTGGTGASANITKTGMSNMDTTGKMFRCRVKVDDITHLAGFNVYLGSSSLANYYKWIVQGGAAGSNFIPSGGAAGAGAGWYTVTLHFADATTSGSPARNTITDLRFQVTDDATAAVTLHVQDAELIPDASATFPNGVVSICFDDTYSSVYTYGLPKLQQYGFPASVYNIQSLVGGSGRMTLAQLYALQDQYGWEMGSHAYLDADHSLTYTGMTAAQLDSDLRLMKAWEIVQGLRGMDGTAYPLGQYGLTTDNVPTTNIVRKYNGYARTTTRKTFETFPPADPYRLRAQSSVTTYTGGYTPATVTGTDLPKIKANQLWGIYVFHNIVTGTPGATTEIAQSDFNSIIDTINSQGIPVLPIGDVLRYYG